MKQIGNLAVVCARRQDVLLQDLRVRMVHGLPYHGRFYGTPKVHQSCDLIHTVFPHIGTASRVDDHKTLPLQKLEGIDDRSPAHIQFRADMAGVQLFPRPVDVSDYTGLDLLIDQVVQTLVLNQINAPPANHLRIFDIVHAIEILHYKKEKSNRHC